METASKPSLQFVRDPAAASSAGLCHGPRVCQTPVLPAFFAHSDALVSSSLAPGLGVVSMLSRRLGTVAGHIVVTNTHHHKDKTREKSQKESLDHSWPGIEPDVGVEPTTLR